MGLSLLIGLILLIIVSVFGIFLFIWSMKRKYKIGILISILIGLSVILCFLTNTIDELSQTKKAVLTDLIFLDIELKDNFKIVDNTVSGMPERDQETVLQISNGDKNNIIDKIRHSSNFKLYKNNDDVKNDTANRYYGLTDTIYNFKYPEFYSRELYRQIDNIPTRIFLSIEDNSNILKYQRFEK